VKKIEIWLNEAQYLEFKEKARRLKKSPYSILKKLTLDFLRET